MRVAAPAGWLTRPFRCRSNAAGFRSLQKPAASCTAHQPPHTCCTCTPPAGECVRMVRQLEEETGEKVKYIVLPTFGYEHKVR